MATRVELNGLSQAKDNFQKLGADIQKEIGRAALREAGWVLARPMRAATYTTFLRRTGAIKSGLGVVVARNAKDDSLTALVEEYPQSLAGAATPFKSLVRQRLATSRRRSTPTASIAFWWRFLEFGTGPRRARATPRFLRTGKVSRTAKGEARQLKSANRWLAFGARGGIRPRTWLRPVFGANAAQALSSFRDTLFKLIDAAVSAMPKK
jgi:hypothetical protein